MFEGMTFILASKAREKVFKKVIPEHGGALNGHKAPMAMFRGSAAKKVLGPKEVTHVVVENALSNEELQENLFAVIGEGVQVVRAEWVSQCLQDNKLVDIGDDHRGLLLASGGEAQTENETGTEKGRKRPLETTCSSSFSSTPMFPTGGLPATLLEDTWQFVRNTGEREGEKCCMFKFMSGASVTAGVPLRIAAFDMDWTVIQPSSGKQHPVDEHDWELLKKGPKQVVAKFHKLHTDGYAIVLMSNQGKLDSQQAEEALQRKVAKVIDALGVPATYMCGMSKASLMRKPCTGMWDLAAKFYQHRYSTTAVDLSLSTSGSFYCGDAAGRLKTKHVFEKKDFANTDYTLALNVGCRFFTPEHFFLDSKLDVHKVLPKPVHAVRHLLTAATTSSGAAAANAGANSTVPPATAAVEIVLLFAPAACGKSTMCARHFPAHVRVNQDTLGTLKRCCEEARKVLAGGRGVVVDNTNLRRDARKSWRDLGTELGHPVRMVVLGGVNRSLSAHLAVLRQLSPELEDRPISNMVLASHYKDYIANMAGLESEGYASVTHVPFSLLDHGPDLQCRLLRAFLPAPPSGF